MRAPAARGVNARASGVEAAGGSARASCEMTEHAQPIQRPAPDSWTELPAAPVAPSWRSSLTWTGRELILLGGHTGAEVEGHAWEHILQLTGLIRHDHQIAWTVHVLGAAVMISAIVWGTVIAMTAPADAEAVL